MKYSNKKRIKIPVLKKDTHWCSYLNKDGSTQKCGFTGHLTTESCWICCDAYNNRIGCSKKAVKEIIKQVKNGKKVNKKKKKKKKKKRSSS